MRPVLVLFRVRWPPETRAFRHQWDWQPGKLGQALQRRPDLEAFDGHDEVDSVAVLAAAEAVKEALVRNDVKGGRFLVVKRAASPAVAAAAAEADVTTHDLYDGQPCFEFLQRNGRDTSADLVDFTCQLFDSELHTAVAEGA